MSGSPEEDTRFAQFRSLSSAPGPPPSDRRSVGRSGSAGAWPRRCRGWSEHRRRRAGAGRGPRPGWGPGSRRDAVGRPDARAGRVGGIHGATHGARTRNAGPGEDRVALPLGEGVASGGPPALGSAGAGRGEHQNDGRHTGHGVLLRMAACNLAKAPPPSHLRRMKRPWLVLGIVWALSGLVVGRHLTRGWVPHDEGSLAQSAERVLAGGEPHRGFDEPYNGGAAPHHTLAAPPLGAHPGLLPRR